MEKDLFLATQAARSVDSPLPLAAQAHAVYSMMKVHLYLERCIPRHAIDSNLVLRKHGDS